MFCRIYKYPLFANLLTKLKIYDIFEEKNFQVKNNNKLILKNKF